MFIAIDNRHVDYYRLLRITVDYNRYRF